MYQERLSYTIDEAAALLGVSSSCVYDCVRRGQIRTAALGRRLVVPVAALEALLGLAPSQPEGGTLNRVEFIGRLTRDPDRRQARSGQPVVALRLAVPRRHDDTAVFIDVVAFGALAQHAAGFAKGQRVRAAGRLDHREWTAEDGSRRSAYQIVASSLDAVELPGPEPVAS